MNHHADVAPTSSPHNLHHWKGEDCTDGLNEHEHGRKTGLGGAEGVARINGEKIARLGMEYGVVKSVRLSRMVKMHSPEDLRSH